MHTQEYSPRITNTRYILGKYLDYREKSLGTEAKRASYLQGKQKKVKSVFNSFQCFFLE